MSEIDDLEEAKLVISMKEDEIKSLTNKMKMVEKKSNIKIAESNYQIQQEKNKIVDMEKKMDKLRETNAVEASKHAAKEEEQQKEIGRLKEQLVESHKNKNKRQI